MVFFWVNVEVGIFMVVVIVMLGRSIVMKFFDRIVFVFVFFILRKILC